MVYNHKCYVKIYTQHIFDIIYIIGKFDPKITYKHVIVQSLFSKL